MAATAAAAELARRRARYRCRDDYVTLDMIQTWTQYYAQHVQPRIAARNAAAPALPKFAPRAELSDRVSLLKGDSTTLEIDAIVNAANTSLLGGGGIDGAIHRAAGNGLYRECLALNGAETGQTKLTGGHNLPARYVLHTVGPIGENPAKLRSCYESSLQLCRKHAIRSVAFCCVSTGIYGYPLQAATDVALTTVRTWLEKDDNWQHIDRIIFVVFLPKELAVYEASLPLYFPVPEPAQQAEESDPQQQQVEESENHEQQQQQEADKQDGQQQQQQATASPAATVGDKPE